MAVYTGKCDGTMSEAQLDIKNSSNPDIANNYGVSCQGIRLPGTAVSTYQLQGKLNYSYGTGSRIFLSALASQAQGRNFTYANLYNPQQIFGNMGNNQVYTLGWTQNLAKSSARALALDVNVSYQKDQFIQSPLTRESEVSSRDPFGGFMISPMKFAVQLRQLPAQRRAAHQLPAEHRRLAAQPVRPREHRPVPAGRQVAEQRLRRAWLHRSGRPDRPALPEPGKPVARLRGARLADRPVQPPQDRRRRHQLRHQVVLVVDDLAGVLRLLHGEAEGLHRLRGRPPRPRRRGPRGGPPVRLLQHPRVPSDLLRFHGGVLADAADHQQPALRSVEPGFVAGADLPGRTRRTTTSRRTSRCPSR